MPSVFQWWHCQDSWEVEGGGGALTKVVSQLNLAVLLSLDLVKSFSNFNYEIFASLHLTIRRVQISIIFSAPPHWSNIRTVIPTPVVIGVIPLIEMNQKIVANHIRHGGNADEVRVHPIHGFQFHSNFEAMLGWGDLERENTGSNVTRKSKCAMFS